KIGLINKINTLIIRLELLVHKSIHKHRKPRTLKILIRPSLRIKHIYLNVISIQIIVQIHPSYLLLNNIFDVETTIQSVLYKKILPYLLRGICQKIFTPDIIIYQQLIGKLILRIYCLHLLESINSKCPYGGAG